MSQHHLPAGCHDAETAAQLLHMSKRALLAKLREMGWLNTGGGSSNHNLPRREFTKNGFMCTQDRGYCLRGKKEISKSYRVMLLTQTGFNALKSELEKVKAPLKVVAENTPASAAHLPPSPHVLAQPEQEPDAPFDRDAAEKERAEAMELMRQWGIAS